MSPQMVREWARQTIPELAFAATDDELNKLVGLIGASVREQCAWECEMAGVNGYGTLAAAALIREGVSQWTKTDSST
jgi:hypothetical protein